MPSSLAQDIAPLLKNGCCIGCGACAFRAPQAIRMERNADGMMAPVITDPGALAQMPGQVCPFSAEAPDEDAHANALFPDAPHQDIRIGRFRSAWAGHVADPAFRANSSSGGITSWILAEAMRLGHIEAVVHVHATPPETGGLFRYAISRSVDEIEKGAKTRYYSVSFDQALREVVASGLRFALVGVPCYIKAARNIALQDPALKKQMRLAVSLVCGHMKAAGFGESLAWQAGVRPDDIAAEDFRRKLPGRHATKYGFAVKPRDRDTEIVKPMSEMAGRSWDGGFLRAKACDYCDDVLGETADVALGDAWLPQYANDDQGTNVFVVRSALVEQMIADGAARGAVQVDPLTADDIAKSQAGGLRDRREGLAYRLWLDDAAGVWHPRKRVTPSNDLSAFRRLTYRIRRVVRRRSFASLRLSKRLGTIAPYRIEMEAWHKFLRLISAAEKKLKR